MPWWPFFESCGLGKGVCLILWSSQVDWWVGEILTFLWSFSKVCTNYFKWKAVENLSRDIILCSSCPPTHFVFYFTLFWLKKGNECSEITVFLLCFNLYLCSFRLLFFYYFRWEGITNVIPASRELFASCPCAHEYDWMSAVLRDGHWTIRICWVKLAQ